MEKQKVLVLKNDDLELPKYETEHSSGMDVRANFKGLTREQLEKRIQGASIVTVGRGEDDKDNLAVLLRKGDRFLFPTGIFAAIPLGYEVQVRPRSGLALKYGITVLNTPGTIDADYRHEWGVVLINNSDKGVLIEHGERIAQLVMCKVEQFTWVPVEKLPETNREGGFGSTGNK